MNQSPKAKLLQAKYIARERRRQWYWRLIFELKECCLPSKSKEGEDTVHCATVELPEISIPQLVEIQQIADVHKPEEIKLSVENKKNEFLNYDDRPWARRRHYYNDKPYIDDEEYTNYIKEDERLPYYKPWSVNHLDQDFKPWARRRHYYNHAQYEVRCFDNFEEEERPPANKLSTFHDNNSRPWARRRHYYNETKDTIRENDFRDDYKPWARRRHYYNESNGTDVRAREDKLESVHC